MIVLHNRPRAACAAAAARVDQWHNSLNGGSDGHGGIDDVPPPAPAVDAPLTPLAPPVDAEPLLAP
jgi:hypothetical protein